MRILFSAWPGYGHLLPMVPLVRAAQRAGHDITIATGPDLTPYAATLGVSTVNAGPSAADSYSRLPGHATISRLPPDEQAEFAARNLFGAAGAERANDLTELWSSWTPDLVVHDPFELGAAAAAVTNGTAQVTHGYGPLHAQNEDMIRHIGAALAEEFGVDPTEPMFAAPYLDICPPAMRARETTAWTDLRSLRPSAGEPGESGDRSIAEVIAALPFNETIYLTLGTVMNQAAGVFHAVLEAAADLEMNVLVTTGPGLDAAAIGPLRDSAIAYPFLPQADALPHCSIVVSHAGAGTMLGALCYGLPQLCLPQSTDQPLNAASVVATGAALSIDPRDIGIGNVAAALQQLLLEPSYRQAAARLQNEIHAMPDGEQVIRELTGN